VSSRNGEQSTRGAYGKAEIVDMGTHFEFTLLYKLYADLPNHLVSSFSSSKVLVSDDHIIFHVAAGK